MLRCAAAVRRPEGEWQPRDVVVQGSERQRLVAIHFVEADVGHSMQVLVTGWSPPSTLDVTTETFTVPPNARLRFGIAARSDPPARAQFAVSIRVNGERPLPLFARSSSTEEPPGGRSWHDVEIPLSGYAGQAAQLRFESSVTVSASLEDAPFPLPKALFSVPVLVTPEPADGPRYNLVLVSIDTLRADHLGAYGYGRPLSPTIDRLAAQGTLFENVITAWPETSASHMTLFTGLYPSVHGIGITKWGAAVLPPGQVTLAEALQHEGFVTGAITEDGLLAASAGFPRGFAEYREFPPFSTAGPVGDVNPIDGLRMGARRLGEAQQVFARGADWLRRHQYDRFFLFLHTYQVHQRYAPGARYDALRQSFVHDRRTPVIERPNSFLATYDAAIAYTDEALSGLLRTLDDLHLTGHTLVIITSDHGEEFYEHGVFGHSETLYDPALRVPLILYCPTFIPAGKRISTEIGLIDLAPTILDLLHLPPLKVVQGRSVGGLVTRGDGADRGPLIAELGDTWRALRTNASKLIRVTGNASPRVEFYDLLRDPGETRPIDASGSAAAQEALRLLQQHDLESQSVRAELQTSAGRPPRQTPSALDEQTRQRLRALGYDVPHRE